MRNGAVRSGPRETRNWPKHRSSGPQVRMKLWRKVFWLTTTNQLVVCAIVEVYSVRFEFG